MSKYSNSEITKDKLINATGELAAELGFSNVSTRAIAERSGENIGSIHYHFGSKENLFQAVIEIAIESKKGVYKVVTENDLDLTNPKEQAKIIRLLIEGIIERIFAQDLPAWHHRVIFQVLQTHSNLSEFVKQELITPEISSLSAFIKTIKPNLTQTEAIQRVFMMTIPIYFHADYSKPMLDTLQMDFYTEKYLNDMEDILVFQTLSSLGLPIDKELK